MTINTIKLDLLTKVAESLQINNLEAADRCVAMYSALCHADTQDKMTEATIGDYNADPFSGLGDDDEPC